MKGLHGLYHPSRCGSHPGGGDLMAAVWRNGDPHSLGEGVFCTWDQRTEFVAYRRAHSSLFNGDDCIALSTDFAVGWILSLAVSPVVGVFLLFLGSKLLDGRVWGSCSPAVLANPGSGREHDRGVNGWLVCERSVRDCDSASRNRVLKQNKNAFRSDSGSQGGG